VKPEDHPTIDYAEKIGVLLINSGTPDTLSTGDVRRFLGKLLGDPRVVELPRLLWLPILHGIILRTRPFRSARKYRKIWTERGSPLLTHCEDLQAMVHKQLGKRTLAPIVVELGMLYSKPSVQTALEKLRSAGARRLLVVPLFPQYSGVTTGAVFDQVAAVLRQWRWIPEVRFINEYHDHPSYIGAIARTIRDDWQRKGRPQHVLFGFHGIPEKYFRKGDPYYCKCHKTARLVAEELGLDADEWTLSFQSRFGPGSWLKPYTDQTLRSLPARGIREVAVVCPGFAADCLETLEEIAIEGREEFLEAGGNRFDYIPALNSHPAHGELIADLVTMHVTGWTTSGLGQVRVGASQTSTP
jgi:ferrochelatase